MPRDNEKPFNGGPAYPGKQIVMRSTGRDDRPLEPCEVEMNGMSVRDVASLQILSALIAGRCAYTSKLNDHFTIPTAVRIRPDWIVEAMDAADIWLELRGQI